MFQHINTTAMKKTLFVLSLFFVGIIPGKQPILAQSTSVNTFTKSRHFTPASAKLALQKYRENTNLYFSDSPESINNIRKNFPEELKNSIEVANQVRQLYFIFRYDWDMEKTNVPYQFKKQIDWTIIPFGDEEWCYMLNRHKYWIDLGRAYLFTGKEVYAKTWVSQVSDWIKRNPVNDPSLSKLSWRRIEAGIRCENWIKSFELFKSSPSVTPQFMALFLNSLYDHAEFINSSFTDFSKTSNWGVLEYQGLYNVAEFMSDLGIAQQWKADAIQKLTVCAQLQVLPDGSQWEQSPMYHNEVFHCLMNVNYLAAKSNTKLPEILIENTKAMAWANVKWQKPNFHQPLTGDSDDTDLRGILTTAAAIFEDGGLKSRANSTLDYENCFLFDVAQQEKYKQMPELAPNFTSVYLPNSGDMIMRSSWKTDASYMNIRLKKLGCGHAHDDLLHFSLFASGRDYLIDGGRYSYVESKERAMLKSSSSHNLLVVDDSTNSIYSSSWSNSFNADSRNIVSISHEKFDYAQADNTAYLRLADPVLMTRRVLFIKPGLWLVFDSFNANGKHKYSQFFNFPNQDIIQKENGILSDASNSALLIQQIKAADVKITDSQWSPEYNLMKTSKKAEFSQTNTGSTSFITALYFPNQVTVTLNKIPVYNRNGGLIADKNVEAVKINYDDKTYIVLVSHQPEAGFNPFFKVENTFVIGKVVLLEQHGTSYITHRLVD